MKPKEWLLANGHIKEITRGRISRENHALIEAAVRDGASIEGYSISKSTAPVKSGDKPTEPVVEKAERVDPNRVVDIPEESRPESQWKAYYHNDGKPVEVGMRTVCNRCGSSLTYCRCEHPHVWLDHERETVVYFKPRTKPLPNKRW